ncbi:hypothetical protein NEUTE1DRAFT_115622 [Neurospora tetrasperma FGSC 2508]|uniref:Uncharacterized protein n=1 Tax=Neurospora tetrasperma (strain FGSC 2508 / ATCC MYA-4615 / P0657) TaxID=510951 RepID=F8MAL3_NEUT8|nr:uncharacterized protein NEUTE1DRAFT_115622 [Neurospora tetrasperma FGSC 2508]EGO60134.1 hypothetical protein NEUTE1DRAFT_115622 [Neurospora tetrasperma FGSC 2508]EGZ75914.1 hypothetical protein NEUTE2DRAFT_143862 [Neurospora tetrasperma FGSC 2509]
MEFEVAIGYRFRVVVRDVFLMATVEGKEYSNSEATSKRDGESSESASMRKSRWPSRFYLNKGDSEYTNHPKKGAKEKVGTADCPK